MPDQTPPDERTAPGPYAVHTAQVEEWAAVADGCVAVFAQYPSRPEPAPVVVFAHGLGGSHVGYAAFGRHLASRGYAVLHPQFLDAFAVVREPLGMSAADEHAWPRDPALRAAMHELLFDPAHWASRVVRMHAVIDSLAERRLPIDLRPDRVVVAGHSYGAYTAQLVLGTRLSGVELDTSGFRHPAAAAGLLLSPQGSGDRGLTPRSWDELDTPLLVVTATHDLGPHGEDVSWRREPYDAAPARPKHLAIVRDAGHLLGGIDVTGDEVPADPGTVQAVSCVGAAFADLVHGDRAAAAWLASGPFPATLHHEFEHGLGEEIR